MAQMKKSRSAPRRQQALVGEIRRRIVRGDYAPGEQLPSRLQLSDQLGYSSITIQRALDLLSHEGFVISRPRSGTFVAESPPHLSRYGLVLSRSPAQPHSWGSSRFAVALHQQALAVQAQEGRQFAFYMGLDGRPDVEDHQRLLADVQAGRLAGVILDVPHICPEVLQQDQVPVVGFYPDDEELPGVATLAAKSGMWLDRALDYLAARGRRRLGMVINGRCRYDHAEAMVAEARSRAMKVLPRWVQGIDPGQSHWARSCVHQLLHAGQDDRPDALLVVDDTLTDHALVGLVDAGVRVPADVDVVAHCNFPWPSPSLLPIKRLGFDVRAAVDLSIDLIDRRRRGEPVPSQTVLRPVFEHELPHSNLMTLEATSP